ncbi:glycoside hydrolase family 23 protein [Ceratobasidium sp. AG-Ba]|nr:glycoside hydrolase family 23 protein [Ceratobasidium sp. AG-Ba]
MKAAVSLIALVASSAVVASDFGKAAAGVSPVHARLHVSHAQARRESGGKFYKRCKPRNKDQTSSSAAPDPTPAPSPSPAPSPPANPSPPQTPPSTGGNGGGVIKVNGGPCGDNGATAKTYKDKGPNGSESWLTCGLENGGWNPPMVRVTDLVGASLDNEFANPNTIFKPCKPYRDMIYSSAEKYGLPPIMIASIMMQESTCNKDTVGGGGEQGLMQITKDKCGGAPGGNCKDPAFNIDKGSQYLAKSIDDSNGNVLQAVGTYNGWYPGLTYEKATAAAKTSCCRCQNNCDYLHQFFNGWMQGIDAYSSGLGTYNNLATCGAY